MLVILVAHQTQGLKTDIAVVAQTIKNHFPDKIDVDGILVPIQLTISPAAVNELKIQNVRRADVVIFFEHIVDHPQFWAAPHRILIPNPEWLLPLEAGLVSRLTEIWHKSHSSLTALAGHFPNLKHSYIGFTSPDFSGGAPDFSRFIHSRGVSIQKQTEVILAAWRKHPEWPELSLQSYVRDSAFLNFPEWLQWKNIRMKYCMTSSEEYRSEVTGAGVHLCPSAIEGFGHYLNEARSIGALVVTTDAPPMNELIDDTCGVLVTPVRSEKQNFGVWHLIDVAGFEKAMQTVLDMPVDQRRARGANARRRYLQERERFQGALVSQLSRLSQS